MHSQASFVNKFFAFTLFLHGYSSQITALEIHCCETLQVYNIPKRGLGVKLASLKKTCSSSISSGGGGGGGLPYKNDRGARQNFREAP